MSNQQYFKTTVWTPAKFEIHISIDENNENVEIHLVDIQFSFF